MRVEIKEYGIVELNFIAATYTGQIEAQTQLSTDIDTLENGTILFKNNITDEMEYPSNGFPYLHATAVTFYEAGSSSSSNFIYNKSNKQKPRFYSLSINDVFHTNTIKLGTEFADETEFISALEAEGFLYGYVDGTDGVIYGTTTSLPSQKQEFIIRKSTMHTDELGFEIRVNKVNGSTGGGGTGDVSSVNGKIGDVILRATDIRMANNITIQATIDALTGQVNGMGTDIASLLASVAAINSSLIDIAADITLIKTALNIEEV